MVESARPADGQGMAVGPYAPAWRKRLAAERAQWARRAEEARASAGRAAQLLARDFGVDRIYLFGSLTDRTSAPFGPGSDVDLAAEGLPAARYLDALDAIADLVAPLDVDLVRLEDSAEPLRRHVLLRGDLLYERA